MGVIKNLLKSILIRPFKLWNIENRAHKALDKQQIRSTPVTAPKHPSTANKIEEFNREHPEVLALQKEKNTSLHKMLEGMVVNPDKAAEIISKSRAPFPVPELRTSKERIIVDEYGYTEPETIPHGKCTIKQAVQFTSDYQTDPRKHTLKHLAEEYKLDAVKLRNVLKYFQTFQVSIPRAGASADPSGHIDSGNEPKKLEKGTNLNKSRQS